MRRKGISFTKRSVIVFALPVLLLAGILAGDGTQPTSAATQVDLGAASTFAVLAATGIGIGAGGTTLNGDIGEYPGTSYTGGGAGSLLPLSWAAHINDTFAHNAQTALTAAISAASGQAHTGIISTN